MIASETTIERAAAVTTTRMPVRTDQAVHYATVTPVRYAADIDVAHLYWDLPTGGFIPPPPPQTLTVPGPFTWPGPNTIPGGV